MYTGGYDYNFDVTSLTYPSGRLVMPQLCVTVGIIGDGVQETDETFTVIFTPTTPDMIDGRTSVTVTITESELSEICNSYKAVI